MTNLVARQTQTETQPFLVAKVNAHCGAAFPLRAVAEVMRPLPIESMAGLPSFVNGLAIIRGEPTPVVELSRVLGVDDRGNDGRFVLVRAGERPVAVAVEAVVGFNTLESAGLQKAPQLLRDAPGDRVEAIGTLDQELLLVLETARLLPNDVWRKIDGQAWGVS